MEMCATCNNIKAGEKTVSEHGMLQSIKQRKRSLFAFRSSDIQECVCHDCGAWWEHKVRGNSASAGWRLVRHAPH